MEDQMKNQIIHGWNALKILIRNSRISAEIHLKKLKWKEPSQRRLTAANPHGGGRVNVLRCGLTCCRGALGFHLAAVCFWASVVQLLRFVLQHDSCSSLFVAMTDSTVQSIQLLCCLASHMLAEDSTWIWLVFDFSRPQRWIWLVNHASQLTLRWVEQRNRRFSTWDQQFCLLLCARGTMWRPRVCIVHGVQKGSGS